MTANDVWRENMNDVVFIMNFSRKFLVTEKKILEHYGDDLWFAYAFTVAMISEVLTAEYGGSNVA